MKELKRGLLFGLGFFAVPAIILGATGIAWASNNHISDAVSQSSIIIDTNTATKLVWTEDDPKILQDLSYNIDTISRDGVIVGIMQRSLDGGKTIIDMPIYKNGYIVKFITPPTTTDIAKLDLQMSTKGMSRVGGKTIVDKLSELDGKIIELETISKLPK